MKTPLLHGALILTLFLMPAVPILCAVCMPGDCGARATAAREASPSLDQAMASAHCGEGEVAERPSAAPVDVPGVPRLECCDGSASSDLPSVLGRGSASPGHEDSWVTLAFPAVSLELSAIAENEHAAPPDDAPTGPNTPLYTRHSSLLI